MRGLDDLSTGDPQALAPDVHFTRGDVNDRPKLWTLLQEVDVVYHLAARVSVPESILYPRDYNAVNVGGTVSLMEAMRDVGIRRVVLASSGAIYGEQGEQPLREVATPQPAFALCRFEAGGRVLRPHHRRAVGHRDRQPAHLQCLRPRPAPAGLASAGRALFSAPGRCAAGHWWSTVTGIRRRDYVYVDDVVTAMVAASTAPDINGLVINVGSGVETSSWTW